jgi:hypothetical protein
MKRDPRFIPPERKTRRDKLNRYWPNVAYLGAGVVGLAECTAQAFNKDSARNKRIIDALRNLRVKITKDKVFLKVPNVRFYDFYLNLRYTDDLNDSNKWYGNEANVGVRCIFYTGKYHWRDADTQCILDQYNRDYSYYSGLGLTVHRKADGTYYATVFLFKVHYDWDDKSSYGYPIGHEFETDLVGSAIRGMRLKLAPTGTGKR